MELPMDIKELAPGQWFVLAGGDEVAGPYPSREQAKRAYPKAG
jgi:hypothetical protein